MIYVNQSNNHVRIVFFRCVFVHVLRCTDSILHLIGRDAMDKFMEILYTVYSVLPTAK